MTTYIHMRTFLECCTLVHVHTHIRSFTVYLVPITYGAITGISFMFSFNSHKTSMKQILLSSFFLDENTEIGKITSPIQAE